MITFGGIRGKKFYMDNNIEYIRLPTGYIDVFHSVEDMKANRNPIVSRMPNKFVDSGKAFCVDFLFGNASWLDGNWTATRYMRVGTSSNTNTGVTGPSFTPPSTYINTAYDGAWQGVSANDFRLTGDVTYSPSQITVLRAGKSCILYATITDSNVIDGASTTYYLTEIGLFLGITVPLNDPVQYPTEVNRENAMIVRAVNYNRVDNEYVVKPVIKAPGSNIIIRYTFVYFEG